MTLSTFHLSVLAWGHQGKSRDLTSYQGRFTQYLFFILRVINVEIWRGKNPPKSYYSLPPLASKQYQRKCLICNKWNVKTISGKTGLTPRYVYSVVASILNTSLY